MLLHIAGNTFTAAELVANGRQLVFGFSDQSSGSTNPDSKEKRVTDGRGRSWTLLTNCLCAATLKPLAISAR